MNKWTKQHNRGLHGKSLEWTSMVHWFGAHGADGELHGACRLLIMRPYQYKNTTKRNVQRNVCAKNRVVLCLTIFLRHSNTHSVPFQFLLHSIAEYIPFRIMSHSVPPTGSTMAF